MIGVLCSEHQQSVLAEFFQLFKTPWELFKTATSYDVVVVVGDAGELPQAKLVVHYHRGQASTDRPGLLRTIPTAEGVLIEGENCTFPIYRGVQSFDSMAGTLLAISGRGEVVGLECVIQGKRVIRVGYDLLDEVEHLLTSGQPAAYAQSPTLDIHIRLLRQWILKAGLSLVEIPPLPQGFNFVTCLTHDVDFIRITDHSIADRSVLGFVARSLFPWHLRDAHSRLVWSRLLKNWKALLSLPAVYLGLARDTWFDIDRFQEAERGIGSTYYFIPRKGHPGHANGRSQPSWRAARYDVTRYQSLIHELSQTGNEIGVHGLDAWQNASSGREERDVLQALSGQPTGGVRMHWLYFANSSPELLEEAEFLYDSTLGYNDTNGFRPGTAQVFRLPGTVRLLELPLNIMDTALFYSGRMGLTEAEAMQLCKVLVAAMKSYGGVLTINWHTRSLCPERNWDSFYYELLAMLKAETVWFATATEAVEWFRRRREIVFEQVEVGAQSMKVELRGVKPGTLPAFRLRVHYPIQGDFVEASDAARAPHFVDIPFTSDTMAEVPITMAA